jgi:RNA polymerase sigma-70 factor, ECF subfamily
MSPNVAKEIEQLLPTLRRFARSLTRDAARADDLVQDTVERALKRIDSFEEGSNLKAWMFTIMRNHFISECRRPRPIAGSEELDSGKYEQAVPGAQQDTVELKEFMAAFSSLDKADQELLILAGLENVPYPDIAEMLGVAVGTVKSRVARARMRLRDLHVGGSHLSATPAYASSMRSRNGVIAHHAGVA